MQSRPRIVVTVQSPEHAANEEVAWRKNDRYFEAVRRHGGDVIVLDENSSAEDRAGAFAAMDGLLLSGGADLDPALYGEEPHPTTVVEPGRDALEQAAFAAAEERRHAGVRGVPRDAGGQRLPWRVAGPGHRGPYQLAVPGARGDVP